MHLKHMAIAALVGALFVTPAFAQSDGSDAQQSGQVDDAAQVDEPSQEAAPVIESSAAAPSIVPAFDPAHPCDQYWQIRHLEDVVRTQAEVRSARQIQGLDTTDLPSLDELIRENGQLAVALPQARLNGLSAGCL